jgi:hypothetical protein
LYEAQAGSGYLSGGWKNGLELVLAGGLVLVSENWHQSVFCPAKLW